MQNGCIQINCGEGKGKTTAALGQALRAAGQGMRVMMFQFLKQSPTGELLLQKAEKLPFEIRRFEQPPGFYTYMNASDREKTALSVREAWRAAKEAVLGEQYDMVILDEILGVAEIGLLDEASLLALMVEKPKSVELILTGRCASEALRGAADYVSEIRAVKHPYQQGLSARRGIEF